MTRAETGGERKRSSSSSKSDPIEPMGGERERKGLSFPLFLIFKGEREEKESAEGCAEEGPPLFLSCDGGRCGRGGGREWPGRETEITLQQQQQQQQQQQRSRSKFFNGAVTTNARAGAKLSSAHTPSPSSSTSFSSTGRAILSTFYFPEVQERRRRKIKTAVRRGRRKEEGLFPPPPSSAIGWGKAPPSVRQRTREYRQVWEEWSGRVENTGKDRGEEENWGWWCDDDLQFQLER